MYVAIEGCSHGELEIIYAAVLQTQKNSNIKVDLLICCGDFQSVRNPTDLKCMAVPTKYMNMQSFYKYYSGEEVAPILTIFIGGNHEASNYLQELPYGGWVAHNIYYLGYGGVINVGGLRIGGISGIYKGPDYLKGRYEKSPYTDSSIRSVYHVRNLEVFRMKQLDHTMPMDIFLSHDWPRGVTKYGDAEKLCRQKKFFREEVESDTLGSRAAQELLHHVQPRFWFAGHLHVKFAAVVAHQKQNDETNSEEDQCSENGQVDVNKISRHTRFLALDKCLPRREFLQILDIKAAQRHKYQNAVVKKTNSPINSNSSDKTVKDYCYYDVNDKDGNVQLYHDLEWLTVLRLTNHLQKVTSNAVYMPGPGGTERYNFKPSEADLLETLRLMDHNLCINRDQFTATATAYDPVSDSVALEHIESVVQPQPVLNPYTVKLCETLGLSDPVATLTGDRRKLGGINKSIFSTPIRMPSKPEMNVTLDSSRLGARNECSVSDDDGDGDIVFEVSITSASDGTCQGELIATPPQRKLGNARKALLLSTPLHSQPPVPTSSVSPVLAHPSPGGRDSPPSSQESSRESLTPLTAESTPVNSIPMSSSQSSEVDSLSQLTSSPSVVESVSTSPKRLVLSSPSVVQSTFTSPKRFLSQTEEEPQTEAATTASMTTTAEATLPKPSKIRRRNAALYCVHNDEEDDQ